MLATTGLPDENDARAGGAGCVSLPPKMEFAVKRWLEQCDPEALDVVGKSNDDIPFNLGGFGEKWAMDESMFLGSKVKLAADPESSLVPLDGEASITVDWSLPLGPLGQKLLYKRSHAQFKKLTPCVPIAKKKITDSTTKRSSLCEI